jgi:hypothetical protein
LQSASLQADAYEDKEDGIYTVGVEIAPGEWATTGDGTRCYWARLDGMQGFIDNHFGSPINRFTIMPDDAELYVARCGTLIYLGED